MQKRNEGRPGGQEEYQARGARYEELAAAFWKHIIDWEKANFFLQ